MPIGPATRCDVVHPRWDVPTPRRCSKIPCDGLRCIFQHVGNFVPEFGISQLIIIQFPNDLQHSDGHSIGFPVMCDSKLSVRYLVLPSQLWASQDNIEMFHREKQTGHTDVIFEEIPAMISDASKRPKSQENDPFHRSVWQGLILFYIILTSLTYIQVGTR